MASRAKSEAKPADPRSKIVDALFELASENRFEDISIRDICKRAGVSLADFRELLSVQGRGPRQLLAPHRSRGPGPGERRTG